MLNLFTEVNIELGTSPEFPMDFFALGTGDMIAFTFDGKRVKRYMNEDYVLIPTESEQMTDFDAAHLILAACDEDNKIDIVGQLNKQTLGFKPTNIYRKLEQLFKKEFKEIRGKHPNYYMKLRNKTIIINTDNMDNFVHTIKGDKHGLAILNASKIKWF